MLSTDLLARVKRILANTDNVVDENIAEFISMYNRAICLHTGTPKTPVELEFVLIELVIARCNMVGNEGIKSERVDIVSTSFNDDIFKNYLPYIEQWKAINTPLSGKPRLRVL